MNIRGDRTTNRRYLGGFALPTVLIASMVMLAVLTVAVSSTAAIRVSLNAQYYNQLAQAAGEAGAAYAKACLNANDGVAQWSDALPLGPDTDCSGHYSSSYPSSVVSNDKVTSTFKVSGPVTGNNNKATDININATTNLSRTDGTIWRKYPQVARLSRASLLQLQVTAGYAHVCAIAFDGKAYCWGYNAFGQVGVSGGGNILTPVAVSGLTDKNMSFIAAGSAHTCAISSEGKVYCWGYNSRGQLGVGDRSDRSTPVLVSGILSGKVITSIAAGDFHTCALDFDGVAYCWGSNGLDSSNGTWSGQLGNNDSSHNDSLVPDDVFVGSGSVMNGKKIVAITAGHSHTCALDSGGVVYCWGDDGYGRLGNGSTNVNSQVPTKVDTTGVLSGKTVVSLMSSSGNADHTCVVASDGKAYCWGYNAIGQLGDTTTTNRSSPVAVLASSSDFYSNGKTVISIAAADTHTCAIMTGGTVYCWGSNDSGQLGSNSSYDQYFPYHTSTTAGSLINGKNIVSIADGNGNPSSDSFGHGFTCAVDSDGKAYCWGTNTYGQFGNNQTSLSTSINSLPVLTFTPPTVNYYF